MSGDKFVATLKSLGYPGAEDMDGESFDWMFEEESALPFLDWFCDEVGPANLLTQQELDEFAEIEASEEGILEGPQLEEALQCLQVEVNASQPNGSDNMEALEEELEWCEERKKSLVQQRNLLSAHLGSLNQRLSGMDKLEVTAKSHYKTQMEQCQADNTAMNESLTKLNEAVSNLSELYRESVRDSDTVMFLSQIDLSSFHLAEEKFTQELTAFTKKQFFEGISVMAGQEEGSRYSFLDVSNPDMLLVRGEREEVILEDCKELNRLQVMYPKIEARRINAMVAEKSAQAACTYVEAKTQALRDKPVTSSTEELSAKLRDAELGLAGVQRDLQALSQEKIPSLIKESACLQTSKILCGDYDLKIARQNYFTKNQDQVINQLLMQRARHEFLTMAYEVEARGHRDTSKLLTAISLFLNNYKTQLADRMALMDEPMLNPARFQRSTVDSRDNFMLNLNKLLGKQEAGMADGVEALSHLFVTYSDLHRGAEDLSHRVESLRSAAASSNHRQQARLEMLESSVKDCESLVYAESSTKGGQPLLTPPAILTDMQKLETMLKQLETVVMETMRDVESKKKSIQADPFLATERNLFVYFHTNPAKLRHVFEELNERLQAQQVK